jgi:energy-coupling factor transport system substrate-specific component
VSWQLAAFLVLGLGLASGVVWYERTRPDARIVALVATLAAFAALGRIAFAALPNIKPTTDIVLVSGYALGGAPGFMVGSIAGLTSNVFFGQGPWTPWQMAAWGVTGLLGAALATATRGRIGRWPLALVCCLIGFLFTVVQDVGDWVTYSDHSTAQLATYVGTGLAFDAIDAGGCLVFALAFGPALLRSLQRFARRLQVRWGPPDGAAVVCLAICVCGLPSLGPSLPAARAAVLSRPGPLRAASAAHSPLAYLVSAQNRDGGLGSAPGQPSSALCSGWAALAFAAAGRNPAKIVRASHSLLAYIEATLGSDPGSVERTILVAVAAGVMPTAVDGHDLLTTLERDIRPDGSVGGEVDLTTFGVLALRAAGVPPPARTLRWLVRQQDADGGFSFATAGDLADVDDTGAALEALAATAPSVRARGVAFIRAAQNHDGGFPSQPGGLSNAQSTAWAVQGLIAAGVNPDTIRTHGSPSPLGYLRSLITASGSIDYARGNSQTPVWVTAEALVALDGKPFPLPPRRPA